MLPAAEVEVLNLKGKESQLSNYKTNSIDGLLVADHRPISLATLS